MLTLESKTVNPSPIPSRTHLAKEFDTLQVSQRHSASIALRRATAADIMAAHEHVSSKIGSIADARVIERVAHRNRENIQMIIATETGETRGCFAQIMLNRSGLTALESGAFNALCPRQDHMAKTDQKPAAIYFWAVVATGRAAMGIAHMSQFLRRDQYRTADIYTVPATANGTRIIEGLGFERLQRALPPSLYRYRRLANRSLFSNAA